MGEFRGRVRVATAADAASIAALVRQCYGNTHPEPECHEPARIGAAIEGGDLVYVVAERDGSLAGHGALKRLSAAGLWDHCRVVVGEAFRNQGVLAAMNAFLWSEVAPALGARFVVTEAVTSHLYAQRGGRAQGFVPTGLLLGLFPPSVVPAGIETRGQPYHALVMARRFEAHSEPRRLTLEGADRDRALEALDALGVAGDSFDGSPAPVEPLGFRVERDPRFGVVHLRYGEGGRRAALSAGFVEGLRAAGARVLWADVPVEHPDAPRVLERLRASGLSYGAYLPIAGRDGGDVVRFQLCLSRLELGAEAVPVIEEAVALRDAIFAEAQSLEAVS